MENIVINLLAGFSVVLGSCVLGGLLPTLFMLLPGNKAQYYTVLETVGKVEEVETKAIVPVRDIYLEKVSQIQKHAPCVEQEWIVVEEQGAGEWIAFTSEVTEIPEIEIVNPEIAVVMAMIAELDFMIGQAEKVITLANEFDAACNEIEEEVEMIVDESDHHDTCVCFTCCPFGVNSMGGRISKIETVKANTMALLADLDTIGSSDRADVFGSYGMTDAQLQAYMDEDTLAQDWYDNQLYI